MSESILVDYISDLHIDTYKQFKKWDKLDPQGEILIIAGDIAHDDNYTVKNFLESISKYYEKIFYVTGNHELYCMQDKYYDYKQKLESLKYMLSGLDKVVYLDGQCVEYKHIKIAGAMGWYDGTYKNLNPYQVYRLYLGWSDHYHITGLNHYNELFRTEYQKLLNCIEDADIVVTHFNPMNDRRYQDKKFVDSLDTNFFCFNGQKLFKKTKAKHWVMGHLHNPISYMIGDCEVKANPYGYPNESRGRKLATFEV